MQKIISWFNGRFQAAQPTATYDASKTYYAPTAAAPAAATVYTVAEPAYQPGNQQSMCQYSSSFFFFRCIAITYKRSGCILNLVIFFFI